MLNYRNEQSERKMIIPTGTAAGGKVIIVILTLINPACFTLF